MDETNTSVYGQVQRRKGVHGRTHHTVANRRRNAVGNAFAVPVVRRILQALVIAHWSKGSQGMEMWADTQLAAPYHPDILDDILPHAQSIAAEFQDLTCELDQLLPEEWNMKLVGADPGAGGRKNRSERAAAVGIQQGTHLSRNGLEMLIPLGLTSPLDHVDMATKLDHPFTKPVNIPLDLQFAASRSAMDPQAADANRRKKMQRLEKAGRTGQASRRRDPIPNGRFSQDSRIIVELGIHHDPDLYCALAGLAAVLAVHAGL